MENIDFQQFVQANESLVVAALEAATADSVLGTYKIHHGSIDVDPEQGKELSEEEKSAMALFQEESQMRTEFIVRQTAANESIMERIGEIGVRQVADAASVTAKRVANAVKTYVASITKMHATLVACKKQLDKLNERDSIDLNFEFGAYSRFFHIAGVPCVSAENFISGIYIHRTTSDWARSSATAAIDDIFKYSENAFKSLSRTIPEMSAAIADSSFDRAKEIALAHYSDSVPKPLSMRGFPMKKPVVPREFTSLKDVAYEPRGYLFDANVLCIKRPKRSNFDYEIGAVILQDKNIARTKVTGWDIGDVRILKAIIDHGIEIASNTLATMDTISKYGDDFLIPISDAMHSLGKRLRLRDPEEQSMLLNQSKIAQILCTCASTPMLSVAWLDVRLIRVIAGIAESHFVKDPKKRIVLKSDIAQI